MEDLAHEDLDRFGRSVSLASMPQQMNNPIIISTMNKNSINKSPLRRYSQESYQSTSSQPYSTISSETNVSFGHESMLKPSNPYISIFHNVQMSFLFV